MNSHNSYLQRDKTTNIGFVRRSPDISDFNEEHKDKLNKNIVCLNRV